jgi:hypothetical protein
VYRKREKRMLEVKEKYVFRYDSGGFYRWGGEARSYAPKHITNSLYDAHQFDSDSGAVKENEQQGNCGLGKYVKLKITLETQEEIEEALYVI